MGRWRRYVVSKMQWQVFRRRESNSKQNHLEEEVLSEMQIQLSDIGSIRAAQEQRASQTEIGKTKKEKVETKAKTNDV